jgi:hypothetical protein
MWFRLPRQFRPRNCLEVGVYRGQIILLWGLVLELEDFGRDLNDIKPFSSAVTKPAAISRRLITMPYAAVLRAVQCQSAAFRENLSIDSAAQALSPPVA